MTITSSTAVAATRANGAVRPALDAEALRVMAREAGADDVGVVSLDRPELADERAHILEAFPWAKSLVAFVCRTSREPIRSPARSIANHEFHETGEDVSAVDRRVVRQLEDSGHRAASAPVGFPMEMEKFPGRLWVISHKTVAEAAGLGRMGIHRLVIHPRFGSFVLLGTIATDIEVVRHDQDQPLDGDPCMTCKLCVAACPTGAIKSDGQFDFSACYTHNYREFMGGFTDWVEDVADAKDRFDYRERVSDAESASMWQSLSYGANYKAAYCMAACPAGDDLIADYPADRKDFVQRIVKPFRDKAEAIYVVPDSDAEAHVQKTYPHKTIRRVNGSLRPRTLQGFLNGLPLVFQPGQSTGLSARYHFTFTGAVGGAFVHEGLYEPGHLNANTDQPPEDPTQPVHATCVIHEGKLTVTNGHQGQPDLRVRADTETWLGFLAGEKKLVSALLTRRLRLSGDPRLLVRFGKCFPS